MFDFGAVDRLMMEGVTRRVFPGAVLWVACRGEVCCHNAYGLADLFRGRPMTVDTLFDLASLTKPLVTALAVMHLVRKGLLTLDRPCADYWPLMTGDGRELPTLRHLLSHCSGLPAWRPYFFRLLRRPAAERSALLQKRVAQEPLQAAPGERVLYSDLGFWVLQWVVERATQQRLDRFWDATVARPLNIAPMHFNDLACSPPAVPYAATELCPWRNRLLSGEVHDDHAHVLGGVAGNAGLFATAAAVGKLLQVLLAVDAGAAAVPAFDRDLVRTFLQRQSGSSWALGFDTPAPRDSSAGNGFGPDSVGHLGFTGTSFWMDRRRALIVVLLTNRVHPTRFNTAIKAFRPRLHDRINAVLGRSVK
ncbi:serine hydrolase domain-containing protein [Desulfatitalea alkaliphila]|uniref:Beta-lactamase family protein n=1 Tax=Desulfatitalea alkaliphila TaxID=2929485 RepID=A0AA41R3C3_9BACT|nr:serine hydrolase domain-containing protein [Desulfatitalea alkaliphila]MCJ8502382.1 beta-lactamase family protein [Desulfatitalea alkaliphila]